MVTAGDMATEAVLQLKLCVCRNRRLVANGVTEMDFSLTAESRVRPSAGYKHRRVCSPVRSENVSLTFKDGLKKQRKTAGVAVHFCSNQLICFLRISFLTSF